MVLINDLTIGDINSALIHLQRARGEVVGGEKGDTIQNISITNKGTSSRDWSNEIERLAKKVSDNEEEIERVRVELTELFNSLVDNHIINVEYIQEDRTLLIETNTDTFEVEIPEDNVKLYINDNVLYFQTPSQTKSVELPYIPLSEKGVANGVATLDSSGRLPYSQLPESAMEFLGEWDASTNTPTLKDGIGTNGNFYIVSVGGTVNFGTQSSPRLITFYPNDRVVYEGDNERWFRLPAGSVVTVNGLSGVVELNGTNVNYDNTSGSPTLKSKIDDVETKAETQSDWNESNSSAIAFIKNKPTIPPAQVQSDWTQTDSTQKDFIKNKIPIWITAGQSGSDMTPVDNITDGQMRPPTSNAVYKKFGGIDGIWAGTFTAGNTDYIKLGTLPRMGYGFCIEFEIISTYNTGGSTSTSKRITIQQGTNDTSDPIYYVKEEGASRVVLLDKLYLCSNFGWSESIDVYIRYNYQSQYTNNFYIRYSILSATVRNFEMSLAHVDYSEITSHSLVKEYDLHKEGLYLNNNIIDPADYRGIHSFKVTYQQSKIIPFAPWGYGLCMGNIDGAGNFCFAFSCSGNRNYAVNNWSTGSGFQNATLSDNVVTVGTTNYRYTMTFNNDNTITFAWGGGNANTVFARIAFIGMSTSII